MAIRCRVFSASRSSNRSAQMRSIRDETASALELYSSMSWIPAAKASSVGARPVVIWERRLETVDGDRGGWIVGGEISSFACDSAVGTEGWRDLRIAC